MHNLTEIELSNLSFIPRLIKKVSIANKPRVYFATSLADYLTHSKLLNYSGARQANFASNSLAGDYIVLSDVRLHVRSEGGFEALDMLLVTDENNVTFGFEVDESVSSKLTLYGKGSDNQHDILVFYSFEQKEAKIVDLNDFSANGVPLGDFVSRGRRFFEKGILDPF